MSPRAPRSYRLGGSRRSLFGAIVGTALGAKEALAASFGLKPRSLEAATLAAGHGEVTSGQALEGLGSRAVEWFGVVAGEGANAGENDKAMARALQWAMEKHPRGLRFRDSYYRFSSPWPPLTAPVAIEGLGNGETYLQWSADLNGAAVTIQNVGFHDTARTLPPRGSRAFASINDARAGISIKGLTLLGDRQAPRPQHGLVLEGNCDFADLDLDIMYFPGRAFWAGKAHMGRRGNMRESRVRLRIRSCGRDDGTAAATLELVDSPENPFEDSSNLINLLDVQCVFPHGRGIEIIDRRTRADGPPIYGMQGTFLLHGLYSSAHGKTGALLHIAGAVTDCEFTVNFAYNDSADPDLYIGPNPATGASPSNLRLNITQPNSIRGACLEAGRNIHLDYLFTHTRLEALRVGAEFDGPLRLEYENDNVYLAVDRPLVLHGGQPALIEGWSQRPPRGLDSFFPQDKPNAGDQMRVSICGLTGTIGRVQTRGSRSVAYDFTPDQPVNTVIPVGSHFSKFAIPLKVARVTSGRSSYRTAFRTGVMVEDSWNAVNLLQLGANTFWIEAETGLLRHTQGRPESASAGAAHSLWKKVYLGADAYLSVAGASLLVVRRGSSERISELRGGADGQRLSVLSFDQPVTIEAGQNVQLARGSELLLVPGEMAEFVYSVDLGRWVEAVAIRS